MTWLRRDGFAVPPLAVRRPAKAEACVVPKAPAESKKSGRIDQVNTNNKLMAMALACNQTKVFSVVHTSATSETYQGPAQTRFHADRT